MFEEINDIDRLYVLLRYPIDISPYEKYGYVEKIDVPDYYNIHFYKRFDDIYKKLPKGFLDFMDSLDEINNAHYHWAWHLSRIHIIDYLIAWEVNESLLHRYVSEH